MLLSFVNPARLEPFNGIGINTRVGDYGFALLTQHRWVKPPIVILTVTIVALVNSASSFLIVKPEMIEPLQ